jgi:succinate dehydrogenase / fumarate reductase cytochrome b subunit
VLGIIVVLGLLLHLFNFWYNMMFAELVNDGYAFVGDIEANDGAALIARTFSNPVFTVLYLVWFAALWFHMTHGFWSAFQTLGLNNKTWFCRWKTIGIIYVSIVILCFVAVALAFFFCAGCSGAC